MLITLLINNKTRALGFITLSESEFTEFLNYQNTFLSVLITSAVIVIHSVNSLILQILIRTNTLIKNVPCKIQPYCGLMMKLTF